MVKTCTSCGNFFNDNNRYGRYRSCSKKCHEEKESQRIENYKKNRRILQKCMYCDNMIFKEDSKRKSKMICSDVCLEKHKKSFFTLPSKINVSYYTNLGFTEIEAKEFVSLEQKSRSPRSTLYWTSRGSSNEEAILKVSEHQRKINELDTRTTEEYRKSSVRCMEFWLDKGYTEEEAKKEIYDIQNNCSKDVLIKRHGIVKGQEIFDKICYNLNYYSSIQYFIDEYGEELGNEKYTEKYGRNRASKASNLFFEDIFNSLPNDLKDQCNIYFDSHNKEFGIQGETNYYFYDFCIPALKICVEFNGDFWHCNPKKYNSGDEVTMNGKSVLVDDIWDYDKKKKESIEKLGYDLIVVWYNKNSVSVSKKEIIEIILNKWRGNEKNQDCKENS